MLGKLYDLQTNIEKCRKISIAMGMIWKEKKEQKFFCMRKREIWIMQSGFERFEAEFISLFREMSY